MAVIRAFRHEVKGHGTRHATDVDCLYFDFLDTGGSRILQLSTLGSDQRQSQPKVSQTFQIGAEGAAELRRILDQTFAGLRPAGEREVAATPPALTMPAGVEREGPIDRFVARAGLALTDELELTGSPAHRRVLARDGRPHIGGDWYLVDFTNLDVLRYADVDRDLTSVPAPYHRAAVFVNEISEDLEQHLVSSHATVVRVAHEDAPAWTTGGGAGHGAGDGRSQSADESTDLPHPTPTVDWVEALLASDIYRAQKTLAGRASVDSGVVRDVLNTLVHLGSRGSIANVERRAGLRPGELREILPLLRRLLNVDGYEALSVRDGGLSVDETLLCQQFGVVGPPFSEGVRR